MKTRLSAGDINPGTLPWLDSALESGRAVIGEYYEVKIIQESRKRSGYTIKTDAFMVYLWKSDPITDVVLEALSIMVHQNPACAMFLTPSEDTVEGFEIFTDTEVTRMWTHSKKQRVLEVYTSVPMQDTQRSLQNRRTKQL